MFLIRVTYSDLLPPSILSRKGSSIEADRQAPMSVQLAGLAFTTTQVFPCSWLILHVYAKRRLLV